MEIRSVCVCNHIFGSFTDRSASISQHTKSLPILSVAQSVKGSYGISIDGGREMQTGELGVFVAPKQVDQTITQIPDEDGVMEAHWVFLDVDINGLYKLDDLYSFPTVLPPKYNREIFELIKKISMASGIFGRLPYLHRIVEILVENAAPVSSVSDRALRLRGFIDNNYMKDISVDELMHCLLCSRSTVYDVFRDEFGESPCNYINRVRIRHAQMKLIESDDTVGEIAAAVGIHDVCYFSRLFRRFTGENAVEYRKSRKERGL